MPTPSARPPPSPGDVLLDKFLTPAGLTQRALAAQMKMPLQRLNQVVRGKRSVTADTALALAAALNTTPEFWMTLQVAVDLWEARQRHAQTAARRGARRHERVK